MAHYCGITILPRARTARVVRRRSLDGRAADLPLDGFEGLVEKRGRTHGRNQLLAHRARDEPLQATRLLEGHEPMAGVDLRAHQEVQRDFESLPETDQHGRGGRSILPASYLLIARAVTFGLIASARARIINDEAPDGPEPGIGTSCLGKSVGPGGGRSRS